MFDTSMAYEIYQAIIQFFSVSDPDELLSHGFLFVEIAYNIIMGFCIVLPFLVFFLLFKLFFGR